MRKIKRALHAAQRSAAQSGLPVLRTDSHLPGYVIILRGSFAGCLLMTQGGRFRTQLRRCIGASGPHGSVEGAAPVVGSLPVGARQEAPGVPPAIVVPLPPVPPWSTAVPAAKVPAAAEPAVPAVSGHPVLCT